MARNSRAVGAAIGASAALGAMFLLLRSSRAYGATRGSVRETTWAPTPPAPSSFSSGKFDPLVERWRPEVTKRAGDLPVDALLMWIQIESDGVMCSGYNTREVGIFQLFFPDDARFGATLEGLRAICDRSRGRGNDISWLSEADLDMEVGAGIRKAQEARDTVRRVLAANGVHWPETSFDFGSAFKQIHAAPAVIKELLPKIVKRSGPPSSWAEFRRAVMDFPVEQMSGLDSKGRPYGLRLLALSPSNYAKEGLKNRLEDTLRNAEIVGRAWASSYA